MPVRVGSSEGLGRIAGRKQELQTIPRTNSRCSFKWVLEARFFERVLHAPVVAGRTCHYEVLEGVLTTARVRKQVIVLGPHALERRVLLAVLAPPNMDFRILGAEELTYLLSDDRHPAKPTVEAVSSVKLALELRVWHSFGCTRDKRRRGLERSRDGVLAAFAPNRFGPLANSRIVCFVK
jgi:hypothetical protein